MENFITTVFGEGATILTWIYALLLAMLGFLMFKMFTYNKRTDKASSFNPYFWWKDNRVEFYLGMIIFYLLMRFHTDILSLLSDNFNFPLITNRYLFVFVAGLLFSIILKRGRKFFSMRQDMYANGEERQSRHVGNRPDDR